jgi:hypothetical protein
MSSLLKEGGGRSVLQVAQPRRSARRKRRITNFRQGMGDGSKGIECHQQPESRIGSTASHDPPSEPEAPTEPADWPPCWGAVARGAEEDRPEGR